MSFMRFFNLPLAATVLFAAIWFVVVSNSAVKRANASNGGILTYSPFESGDKGYFDLPLFHQPESDTKAYKGLIRFHCTLYCGLALILFFGTLCSFYWQASLSPIKKYIIVVLTIFAATFLIAKGRKKARNLPTMCYIRPPSTVNNSNNLDKTQRMKILNEAVSSGEIPSDVAEKARRRIAELPDGQK